MYTVTRNSKLGRLHVVHVGLQVDLIRDDFTVKWEELQLHCEQRLTLSFTPTQSRIATAAVPSGNPRGRAM